MVGTMPKIELKQHKPIIFQNGPFFDPPLAAYSFMRKFSLKQFIDLTNFAIIKFAYG